MVTRLESGYIGSDKLEISQTNQEFIPSPPENKNKNKYNLYKSSFLNSDDCTVF